MSRYDGLIIPRSYNEYINKSDPLTLAQALQQNNVLSGAVAAGDNKAVKSAAVATALANYCVFKSGNNLKCNYTKLNGLVVAHFTYRSSIERPIWSSFFNLPVPISGSAIRFTIGDTTNNYVMFILGSTGLVQNGIILPAGEYYGSVSYEHA